MRELIEKYLEDHIEARERSNKNTTITRIINEKHNPGIDLDLLQVILEDVLAADRYWRKTLQDREELRGTDYNKKDVLELQAQVELGYSVVIPQKETLYFN